MNILWISHLLPFPPRGGAALRSYNLIKQAARYNSVDLITFNQKSMAAGKEHIQIAKEEFLRFCENVIVLNIPCDLHRFGTCALAAQSFFTIDPYSINWLKSHKMHKVIRSSVCQKEYDLVWFDTISLVPYLKDIRKSKIILNHHNIESEMMLRRATIEKNPLLKVYFFLEGLKLRLYERKYCHRFALNVTCSALDSERLLKRIEKLKTAIIPNGVDIKYFCSTGISKENCSLVFAGDLSWYPNREAILYFAKEVWPLLVTEIPDVKMTVVGKKPPDSLYELAYKDKRFVVAGFVDDVRPYIEKAAVYVCPITNGGGTKLKILDALAMSKAIVAHPVACEGIDVVDNNTVLYATTAKMYVEKIKWLFQNSTKCELMGNQGRLLVKSKYSYEKIGFELNEEFKNVCST